MDNLYLMQIVQIYDFFLIYRKYSVARTTQALQIPYYVKENFHSEYQGSLRRLESSIEDEYFNNVKLACAREKNYSMYIDRIISFSLFLIYFFSQYLNSAF